MGQRQSNVQRDRRLLDRQTHTHTNTHTQRDHATWRRTVLLITHLIADLASNFARKKLYITFHTFPVTLCCLVLITGKPPTEYHSTPVRSGRSILTHQGAAPNRGRTMMSTVVLSESGTELTGRSRLAVVL